MIFIKTLMNADLIYANLMELKLNLRIGPNSIVKRLFVVTKKKMLSLCLKTYSFSCSKKTTQLFPTKKLKRAFLHTFSIKYRNRILRMASYFTCITQNIK